MHTFRQYLEEKWTKYEAGDIERGPHQGRELEMLLAGKKPVAEIEPHRIHEFMPYIETGKLIHKKFKGSQDNPMHLVALPHERKRMEMTAKEFQRLPRRHARLGILLGYPRKAIKGYLDDTLPRGTDKKFKDMLLRHNGELQT